LCYAQQETSVRRSASDFVVNVDALTIICLRQVDHDCRV
jgi:hypothetical protein